MRFQAFTRYAAAAAVVGALGCAGNKARTEDTATARDSAGARDTLNGQTQNPPGYRGMERDTTLAPSARQEQSDTFMQKQGTGQPQDTSGYSGMERVDTTRPANGQAQPSGQNQATPQPGADTSGYGRDSSGAGRSTGMDSTGTNQSSAGVSGLDSTGTSKTGDTTGYAPTKQQSHDSMSH